MIQLFFLLTLLIDKTGVYSAYFYFCALLFLLYLAKSPADVFSQRRPPIFLIVLVFLVFYLVFSSVFVNGVDASYRALGNSVETLLFVFMSFSSFLIILNKKEWASYYFFGLVTLGAAVVCYPYLIDGYGYQRVTGPGFLSKAILGPSVIFIYWSIGVFLYFTTKTNPVGIVAFIVATASILAYALLTQSRGPIISVLVGFSLVVLISARLSDRRYLFSSLLVIFASISIGWHVFSGFFSLDGLVARGWSYRPEIWRAVLETSKSSFWLGNGVMKSFSDSLAHKMLVESIGLTAYHAHNTFLQLFHDGGFFGVTIFVVAIAIMVLEIKSNCQKRERYWIGFILVATVMINFTDTSKFVSSPKEAWVMLWLPLVFVAALIAKEKAVE